MKLPKRGEKGFTLIELLIVVAILGVLAAVVIPNVGRFLGRGEAEARRTEFHNVSSSVIAMMTDNNITTIPNPIDYAGATGENDMSAFPDATSVAGGADKLTDPDGTAYAVGDGNGYVLYGHDRTGGGAAGPPVSYVTMSETTYYYTCEDDGTLRQFDDAALTTEYTY
jgi:prepilin-type N-terminal cleavage/methylation domain-containing protein